MKIRMKIRMKLRMKWNDHSVFKIHFLKSRRKKVKVERSFVE